MNHADMLDALKLAGGIASAFVGAMFVAIGLLFRVAYRLGGDAKEIKDGLARLTRIEERTEKIPLHDIRISHLEDAWRGARSDIKDLLRGSRPDSDFDGE